MKTVSKALVGTVAAGAMAMAAVAPAAAQDRGRQRDHDGISAGEVIAGAVILGGLAAVIASSDNDRDRYDDRDYRGADRDYRGGRGGYGQNGGGYRARAAVEECVRAAERQASFRGRNAEVYEVADIDRSRRGFEISGRIAVRNEWRGRGWGGDYRRGHRNNGWDEGRFTCDWNNGRVTNIDFGGLRGL